MEHVYLNHIAIDVINVLRLDSTGYHVLVCQGNRAQAYTATENSIVQICQASNTFISKELNVPVKVNFYLLPGWGRPTRIGKTLVLPPLGDCTSDDILGSTNDNLQNSVAKLKDTITPPPA